MKKAIALMLAVCCILGVLVMGVSAAKADDTAAQARYDPWKQRCIRTAFFRETASKEGRILGQFEPGEVMRLLDLNYVDWMFGCPMPDTALYRHYGYSIEGYAACENFVNYP